VKKRITYIQPFKESLGERSVCLKTSTCLDIESNGLTAYGQLLQNVQSKTILSEGQTGKLSIGDPLLGLAFWIEHGQRGRGGFLFRST
jgi:hypothetical protein